MLLLLKKVDAIEFTELVAARGLKKRMAATDCFKLLASAVVYFSN